ncbi:hypothetical protein JRO89_XS03G0114800 [Xanthoceras sorbifolium]|uniref:DNA-directed RNA polymerase subunit n=1 Tax=Xanthoceras sorbifolium TaxID=99658 RepID=A0ABQ8IAJ7_9ROSI|nr:hypothetical protein JRO89_XS03G0114800 [Xanthoceras sorbifolium]
MFSEVELLRDVAVLAENLDRNGLVSRRYIVTRLLEDLLKEKANKDLGYFLAVTSLKSIGNRETLDESGNVFFPVVFKCRTFMPFRGEVLEGVVHHIYRFGAFLQCGPVKYAFLSFRKMPNYRYVSGENPAFVNDELAKIENNVVVRFLVLGVRWIEKRGEIMKRDFVMLASLEVIVTVTLSGERPPSPVNRSSSSAAESSLYLVNLRSERKTFVTWYAILLELASEFSYKMFLKIQLSWNVVIPAESLESNGLMLQRSMILRLLDDFASKKASKDLGYYLAVTTLDNIGEGKVRQNTGDVLFPVRFSGITFKIFRGEIIEGIVHKVLKHGVFLRCGPIENIYLSNMKMPDYRYVPGEDPEFLNDKLSKIKKDVVIRTIVLGTKWLEAEREFQALVSLEGDYLGPVFS